MPINRSFLGRNRGVDNHGGRLPPGQSLTLKVGPRLVAQWTLADFRALPQSEQVVDIHCVTTWSKFDTRWRGVTVDDLLAAAGVQAPTPWVLAHSQDGYSTNLPLADLTQGRAMVATHFDDKPLTHEHGGPARLLVPHLYFWKSGSPRFQCNK